MRPDDAASSHSLNVLPPAAPATRRIRGDDVSATQSTRSHERLRARLRSHAHFAGGFVGERGVLPPALRRRADTICTPRANRFPGRNAPVRRSALRFQRPVRRKTPKPASVRILPRDGSRNSGQKIKSQVAMNRTSQTPLAHTAAAATKKTAPSIFLWSLSLQSFSPSSFLTREKDKEERERDEIIANMIVRIDISTLALTSCERSLADGVATSVSERTIAGFPARRSN